MNVHIHARVLALLISASMMHAEQTTSAVDTAVTNNTAATVTSITADIGNIVSTAGNLAQNHTTANILAGVGQLVGSLFSIISNLVAHKDINDAEDIAPVVVELSQEQVELVTAALLSVREDLENASLQVLGRELEAAESALVAIIDNNEEQGNEQADSIVEILNALMHDLFAIIQSGNADAEAIGQNVAEILSDIIEQAIDTVKYEQIEDIEMCTARCIDRACAELSRQMHRLMVQSALTLRNSACTIACCRTGARPCAATIAMITGNAMTEMMTTRCNCSGNSSCSFCGKCSSCNNSSTSCTCNKPSCSTCGRRMMDAKRCPCNKPKPAVTVQTTTVQAEGAASRRVIVKCPCMNNNKPKTNAPAAKGKIIPSYKDGHRVMPEQASRKKEIC